MENLIESQRKLCREIAQEVFSLYGDDNTRTYGEALYKYKERKQAELDRQAEMDGSPRVCLQKINSTFILGWQKQIGKYSDENAINRKYEEYIQAFFDKYFESMFDASNTPMK